MKTNQNGVSVYRIVSIIFLLALIAVLSLPKMFDLNKKQKAEDCIRNMKEIKSACETYMSDRNEVFTGNTGDLVRFKYLKTSFEECPEGSVGDKYIISINKDTREVTVKCPNEGLFKDHVLSTK